MDKKIDKVLDILHNHFKDENKRYSEYESSDMEYFVACMLYNHFAFSKALENLKTMDLPYDFLSAFSNDEYEEFISIIKEISFDDEEQKLSFLLEFIDKSKKKYKPSELYLLNRVDSHVKTLKDIYDGIIMPKKIDFGQKNTAQNSM